jgi:fluoride exporter
MLRLILLVGTGGFLGTVSRFLTSRYFAAYFPSSFPYGTFVVNIVGCLLIGLVYGITEKGNFISTEWRLFLTVGFCGGFTTFSAFAAENMAMLRDSEFFNFFLYTGGSIFIGLLATFAGIMLIKIL